MRSISPAGLYWFHRNVGKPELLPRRRDRGRLLLDHPTARPYIRTILYVPFPPLAGGVLSEHTVFVGVRARYFATALIIVAVVAFGAALYFAFNRIEFGDAACGPAFASA